MSSFERRRRPIQVGLWYMAITTGLVSTWILIAPRRFYDEFPTGPAEWVSALPPFNEHLLRDFGAAGLGLAVLAALAALGLAVPLAVLAMTREAAVASGRSA